MHRYSLSSSSVRPARRRPARSFFRAIFFGPRGNICGSCEAVDRRRDSAPRTRQVLTFRGSPSPANYACLFLPLPLFSSVFRPYERPPSLSFRPPPVCPHGFFSHLLSLPFACTLPFLSSLPPSFLHLVSLGVDLLHSVALVPTSYIPPSVLTHSTFPAQLLSFRSY